jgi:RNA polymerase sigma factor (sigma-70 family)
MPGDLPKLLAQSSGLEKVSYSSDREACQGTAHHNVAPTPGGADDDAADDDCVSCGGKEVGGRRLMTTYEPVVETLEVLGLHDPSPRINELGDHRPTSPGDHGEAPGSAMLRVNLSVSSSDSWFVGCSVAVGGMTTGQEGARGHVLDDGASDLDEASIEELYRTQYEALVRLAGLLLGDFQSGEEIAQDAFARLIDTSGRVFAPVAYLRGTVVNLSRSRIRRAIMARRYGRPPERDVPGPEERTEGLAVRISLRKELQRLPPRQREAIVLRFYGGLADAEIAAAMRVSTGSVKTHLHRALASLSERMEALR